MVVENVRGAQPWVGRSRWAFGSYHLWGDVPALMPPVGVRKLSPALHLGGGNSFIAHGREAARHDARHAERREAEITSDRSFQTQSVKISGGGADGWFGDNDHPLRQHTRGHPARKAASALIAKIPLQLARHVARVYWS